MRLDFEFLSWTYYLSSQATPFSCTVKSTKVISSHIFVPDTMISDAKSWSWFCAPHSRALQIVQSNHSARTHFQFQSKLNSQKWCQDRLDQVHQECVGDWSSDPDAHYFLMQVHDRLTKHNSRKNSHEYRWLLSWVHLCEIIVQQMLGKTVKPVLFTINKFRCTKVRHPICVWHHPKVSEVWSYKVCPRKAVLELQSAVWRMLQCQNRERRDQEDATPTKYCWVVHATWVQHLHQWTLELWPLVWAQGVRRLVFFGDTTPVSMSVSERLV